MTNVDRNSTDIGRTDAGRLSTNGKLSQFIRMPSAGVNFGLGKTFAAWAGILKIVESSHEKWKILIVCPLGVVANWRSSIQWMGTNRWVEEVVILNYERLGKIFEANRAKVRRS